MAEPNDSGLPDSVRLCYREDAVQLSLRDVHANEEAKKTVVFLPAELIQFYYSGLLHIYQAALLPERDSVTQIYKIHTFPTPEAHSLIVAVDSTEEWTQAWKNNQRFTGNQEVDNLINQYNLELQNYIRSSFLHAAVLYSSSPINTYALALLFMKIKGVGFAEPNGGCCDGSNIYATIHDNYVEYTFSVGHGDCPSGCINRRYWVFQVSYNGNVQFVRSYGDAPLPHATYP